MFNSDLVNIVEKFKTVNQSESGGKPKNKNCSQVKWSGEA